MSDERIGQGADYPARTWGGNEYTRPATTLHIIDGYFIVLDAHPDYDPRDAKEDARAMVTDTSNETEDAPEDDTRTDELDNDELAEETEDAELEDVGEELDA